MSDMLSSVFDSYSVGRYFKSGRSENVPAKQAKQAVPAMNEFPVDPTEFPRGTQTSRYTVHYSGKDELRILLPWSTSLTIELKNVNEPVTLNFWGTPGTPVYVNPDGSFYGCLVEKQRLNGVLLETAAYGTCVSATWTDLLPNGNSGYVVKGTLAEERLGFAPDGRLLHLKPGDDVSFIYNNYGHFRAGSEEEKIANEFLEINPIFVISSPPGTRVIHSPRTK